MFTSFAVRRVNAELRAKDESNLWPISGAFNVTDRAIRRLRDQQRAGLVIDSIDEYRAAVEAEVSRIVNDPRNH